MSCLMRTSIQLNYVQWLHQLRQWFTITVTRLLATIAQSLSNQIHCICNRLLMTTVNVLSYWFVPWKIQFISIHFDSFIPLLDLLLHSIDSILLSLFISLSFHVEMFLPTRIKAFRCKRNDRFVLLKHCPGKYDILLMCIDWNVTVSITVWVNSCGGLLFVV